MSEAERLNQANIDIEEGMVVGSAKYGHVSIPRGSCSVGSKLNPICVDDDMKETAMSASSLSEICFPSSFSYFGAMDAAPPAIAASPPSSLSSVSTKETFNSNGLEPMPDLHERSLLFNTEVVKREVSRQGRGLQRWSKDPKTNRRLRLVTGTVPILLGGRILLISASRKRGWILPKGGWEQDETMEESAIRETFEEGGVVGTLGPALAEVLYESGKAKRRRLFLEERQKSRSDGEFSSACSEVSQLSEEDQLLERSATYSQDLILSIPEDDKPQKRKAEHGPDEGGIMSLQDEASAGSLNSSYTHVGMSLFPLYVTKVVESWPESGRVRKAFEIDDAIEALADRPEFQAVLKEVKSKGLHLAPAYA